MLKKRPKVHPIYLHLTPAGETHDTDPCAECFCEPVHIDRIETGTRPVIIVIHREELILATLVAKDIPPHRIQHASLAPHKSQTPPPKWDGNHGVTQ